MPKKYKILIAILGVVLILAIIGITMINKINREMEALTNKEITNVDLSLIEDGTYLGTYESLLITVKVEVMIENHIITDISILEHTNGQGDGADVIIDDVLVAQSIEVDMISGATYSSKAILLAISDALSE